VQGEGERKESLTNPSQISLAPILTSYSYRLSRFFS
jgi:hypothetical protein